MQSKRWRSRRRTEPTRSRSRCSRPTRCERPPPPVHLPLARGGTLAWKVSVTAPTDIAGALDSVLVGRRSIRTYDERPVPPELLERVLSAAAQAPSPHHSMPWRLAV